MIKRYNQFVKTNENAPAPSKPGQGTETAPSPTETPSIPKPARPSVVPTEEPGVKDNPLAYGDAVEGGLEGLAELLGASVERNVISYEGHEIDQPSETGQFRVDGIDLKTDDVEKVVDYLNNPEAQAEAQGKKEKRVQAQAQRRAQAQGEFESGSDKTETGLDPEAQSLKAQVVDIDQIEESKSYKNRTFKRKF
jgi:hypothetical protein